MKKDIRVCVVGHGLQELVGNSFVKDSSKHRLRCFYGNNHYWSGRIYYGGLHRFKVNVSLIQVNGDYRTIDADWFIISRKMTRGHFSTCPRRIAKILSENELPKGKVMIVNQIYLKSKEEMIARNAANHLGAEITNI